MGDTAQAKHQSLIERHMGSIIMNMSKDKRDELKRKLEEADDSPNNVDMVYIILGHPQVLKTQDNLEETEGEGDNKDLRRQCRSIK